MGAQSPEDVLAHVPVGADVIVPMVNGEPVAIVDALEANHERLEDVRLHHSRRLRAAPASRLLLPGRGDAGGVLERRL